MNDSIPLTVALREVLKANPQLSHYELIEAHVVNVEAGEFQVGAYVKFITLNGASYSVPFQGTVPDYVHADTVKPMIATIAEWMNK